MKEKYCQPDETTFSIMIEAYRKEGMHDKIYDLEKEREKIFISVREEESSEEMEPEGDP